MSASGSSPSGSGTAPTSSPSSISSIVSGTSFRIFSVVGGISLAALFYYLGRRRGTRARNRIVDDSIPGWEGLTQRQKEIILRFFRSYRQWYLSYKFTSVSTPATKSPLDSSDDAVLIDALKVSHANAMKVFPYKCVRQMRFALPRISTHPVFLNLFHTSSTSVDPSFAQPSSYSAFSSITLPNSVQSSSLVFVDLGCCFGTDSRALLSTGLFNPSQIFCVDITSGFFDLGCKLFEDADLLSKRFSVCDILQENCWQSNDLKQVNKAVNLLYAGSVYHLFELADTKTMTKNVYSVLAEGGIFFGRTVGSGLRKPLDLGGKDSGRQLKYLHTKDSLKKLLEEAGFQKVVVEDEEVNQAFLENMLVTKGVAMLAFAAQK